MEDTGELYIMLELVPEVDTWTPFGDAEVEQMPVDGVDGHRAGDRPHPEVEQILTAGPSNGQARRDLVGGRAAEPPGPGCAPVRRGTSHRVDELRVRAAQSDAGSMPEWRER